MFNKRASKKINTAAFRRKLRKLNINKFQSALDVSHYRGLEYSDYEVMTLEKILSYMSSSVKRYYSKGLKGVDAILFNKLITTDINTEIRTHARNFFILPIHAGRKISIYNY